MRNQSIYKIFKKTVLINSILFLISIILSTQLSFNSAYDILRSELESANKTVLNQTQINIDTQLYSIEVGISELLHDKVVHAYLDASEPSSLEKINICELFKHNVQKNSNIINILLYAPKSQTLISQNGITRKIPDSYKIIIDDTLSRSKGKWHKTQPSVWNATEASMPYAISVSGGKGVILVEVRESFLYNAINQYKSEQNGVFFILAPDGTTISHMDKTLLYKNEASEPYYQKLMQADGGDGAFNDTYMNRSCLMVYNHSPYTHWLYISAIPYQVLSAPFRSKQILLLAVGLFLFLLSALIAYILLMRMYRPMNRFTTSIAEALTRNHLSENTIEDPMNLYALEHIFDEFVGKHINLQSDLTKSADDIRWKMMMDVFLGFKKAHEDFISSLAMVGIELYPANFIVMICDIIPDGYEDTTDNMPRKKAEETKKIHEIIKAKLNSAAASEAKSYSIDLGNTGIISLLSFESDDADNNTLIALSIANEIHNFMSEDEECSGYRLFTSVSYFHRNAAELHQAYSEATYAMKYKSISQDSGMLLAEDFVNPGSDQRMDEIEKNIDTFVSNFGKFSAQEAMDEFVKLSNIMITSKIPFNYCKALTTQIIMLIVARYVKSSKLLQDKTNPEYLNTIKLIDYCDDMDSMQEVAGKLLVEICEITNNNQAQNNHNLLVYKAMKYIDENYTKSDTNLSTVAAAIHVSDSHLSRLFKTTTGSGFAEYLISKRIETAKDLLVTTEQSVRSIALTVGYNNDASFIKIFKRYTGMTPSEYKKCNIPNA